MIPLAVISSVETLSGIAVIVEVTPIVLDSDSIDDDVVDNGTLGLDIPAEG